MKLKSISFGNYKAFFEEQKLEIKPITILIGKNSSGKSSIAKLFPLLDNSLSGNFPEPLLLTNYNVALGGEFRDLVFKRNINVPINFKLEFEGDIKIEISIIQITGEFQLRILEWNYTKSEFSLNLKYDPSSNCYKSGDGEVYYCKFNGFIPYEILTEIGINIIDQLHLDLDLGIDVDYIGPFRILPDRQFHLIGQFDYKKTGVKGENAYPILGVSKDIKTDLHIQVGNWFEQNFDGWRLEVDNRNVPFKEFKLVKNETSVNIVDVGQGMGQALPLIVRSHVSREYSLIIVEQPELHLHPAAHGELAELFAKSAKENGQSFIIETHSENILLRIRRLIIEKKFSLAETDVIIYYVKNADVDGQELMEITIDEDGVLSTWPEGIFNENLDEVQEMRKALTRKKNGL